MPGFAVGCPQLLAVRQGASARRTTSILSMAADPTGHYIAILTRHDLQIWSAGHHQLLLGWATTIDDGDEEVLLQEDEEVYVKPGVMWSRGGQEICALRLDGAVAFFQVHYLSHSPHIDGIPLPEWMDLAPGEGVSSMLDVPHAVDVLPLRRLYLGKGQRATCLSAGLWRQHLLLGKDKETAILDVSWNGYVQNEYSLVIQAEADGEATASATNAGTRSTDPPILPTQLPSPPAILLQICYSDVSHMLGAVLADGRVLLSNLPGPRFSVQTLPASHESRDPPGVVEALAFSPVDAVLAVGYDDGSVAVFRILSTSHGCSPRRARSQSPVGASPSRAKPTSSASHPSLPGPAYPAANASEISIVFFRRLSLASLGLDTRQVGAVMHVEYSPDGSSLAVAHRWSCSLNVWDTCQWCRPMTTFPRGPETPATRVKAAVSCLLWIQEGYRLLVAHNQVREEEIMVHAAKEEKEPRRDTQAHAEQMRRTREGRSYRRARASACIVRYEMLRWARRAAFAHTALCLQGVNTLAFLEQRPWNPRLLSWAHVTVPPAYSVNLPVTLVAQSPSGQQLAVAGKRGLALYSRPQRRWRLFGNVHQERELEVAGMTWWGEDAVVVVAKLWSRAGCDMLVYSRHHLDNSSLLCDPVPLPPGTRPLFLECVKDRHDTVFRSRSRSKASRRPGSGSLGTGRGRGVDGATLDGVYWTDSAVLMVGDVHKLLFYRLARDHSPRGVSIALSGHLEIPSNEGRGRDAEATADDPNALHSDGIGVTAVSDVEPSSRASNSAHSMKPMQTLGDGETARRIVLLPEVSPLSVALLSSTDTLYQIQVQDAATFCVGTGVSNLWELSLPTGEASMRPCYVLYCGDRGFSLWLPSFCHKKALQLTREACQEPFLDPTFNPDVEGVIMGIHGPTSSLIFLTQSCTQPQSSSEHSSSADRVDIPPRFQVGLQRRPCYQVAFRFLLFLHSMLKAEKKSLSECGASSDESSLEEARSRASASNAPSGLQAGSSMGTKTTSLNNTCMDVSAGSGSAAEAVAKVVAGIFDELYSQPATRIQLADALDFLLRSCIEAVGKAQSRLQKQTRAKLSSQSPSSERGADREAPMPASYFTSLLTSTEQVKEALALCQREAGLGLFYEVIVRVARKIEPSRLKYMFPLPDLNGQGFGDTPVTLFHKCLRTKKLHTALLYLPLIDPPQRMPEDVGPLTPSSDRRTRLLANKEEVEDVQRVHRLALELLWAVLRRGGQEWRMLKQLWRFIQKREEAMTLYAQEADVLNQGGGNSGLVRGNGSGADDLRNDTGNGLLFGALYRATFGMLGAPSGAGCGGSVPQPKVMESAGRVGDGAVPPSPWSERNGQPTTTPPNAYLLHLPRTMPSVPATRGEGAYAWMYEPDEEAAGPHSAMADFDVLQHADSGVEVLTLFASMCLATLRLREVVDALLLLGGGDPRRVPFPTLQPWMKAESSMSTGYNARHKEGGEGSSKWQQHATSSSLWPWARFEAPKDIVLDTFLAICEQFLTSTPSTSATGAFSGKKWSCTPEECLAVFGRVCVELRDYECLLALGTFSKDTTTVTAALKRSTIRVAEYRRTFLDDRMEAGGLSVKEFVQNCTEPFLLVEDMVRDH